MTEPNSPALTAELIADHGLSADEYDKILHLIGREPTLTELGIFSAMWNEHCSYKSSRKWLRTLPVDGACVIQGPGENAGIVDIGDGQVAVFKMESHNHPSFIEPHQGAATGVGGILRDIFTMGARPVAVLNALRFGAPEHERTRHLVSGVVGGIGGYGNSFGVPTIGGEVEFHSSYDGNILVNAMAIGLARADAIFYSQAKGVGLPIVYLGSKTGRDGIHGSTMASSQFDDDSQDKRPTVQVGDPFSEKRLLEACLELMATGAVIAIQDMGAAGLTCSAVEMGAKGDLGVHLNLDFVPCREEAMSAYEMMLSESQERMLMVLRPELQDAAETIFRKWQLDFAVIGKTTDTLRFVVEHRGQVMADLPIKELGDEAPEYDRPWTAPMVAAAEPIAGVADVDAARALAQIVGSPNHSSRRWIWEQYDHLIQANTAQIPGGDAGVVRIEGTTKGLAACVDVTPRYVEADAFEGGKQAVAECWRNLTAVGANPLAITDNLNFGNPERPEIMGQFVRTVDGIGAACRALDFPVVSGNVSLYNETNGRAISPTPAIGGIGLIDDIERMATIAFKSEGHAIVLIGAAGSHLWRSTFATLCLEYDSGPPPPVDLDLERRHGDFVRRLILTGVATACHDLSDGGLALALAEMAMAGNIGCGIALPGQQSNAVLFGEDQARYIITCSQNYIAETLDGAEKNGIEASHLGTVGGKELKLGANCAISLDELQNRHENWFANYMSGPVADGTWSN
jgi:phosphoribosylformylglycinamidine synthase II